MKPLKRIQYSSSREKVCILKHNSNSHKPTHMLHNNLFIPKHVIKFQLIHMISLNSLSYAGVYKYL